MSAAATSDGVRGRRTVDHSAFRIFACTACNFVQWIPD
jgi:hypothetical protein